ncbi:HAD family acid phosphatase [Kitasatospora aburaviensis]
MQAAAPATAARAAATVTESQWLADVKTSLAGARGYVEQRTSGANAAVRPAIVFDIDNTTLQTHPFSQPAVGPSSTWPPTRTRAASRSSSSPPARTSSTP